ncbi:MAG: 23S rRNA (adenine(2503)-C(2))-methyltransferase RlmN [Halobacteriovoraceae bacterium]|nr:23S rRNA (adenine(2503)-C(2))-methyltransferase RlmN [Halobacteriovoraceae bacterium]
MIRHMKRVPLLSYSYQEICQWWCDEGAKLGPQKRIFSEIIRSKLSLPLKSDSEISDKLLHKINETFEFLPLIAEDIRESKDDRTIKYLFRLSDGTKVESVAVPFHKKYTLCLSSQVGCAMGCKFCFTGTTGLTRHLKKEEILGQYLFVWNHLKDKFGHPSTPNIVFMGQGEPLHNFDVLKESIESFLEFPGLGLGPKQITVSTVGHAPGLKRWQELPPVNLAISLHSPFEKERTQMMPVNKVWSIDSLLEILEGYPWHHRKRINFEYLLLGDHNDSLEHADALADIVSRFPSMVNLIPFNPYPESPFQRPSDERLNAFKLRLVERKIRTMVRTTKGDDILAACGQLANQ